MSNTQICFALSEYVLSLEQGRFSHGVANILLFLRAFWQHKIDMKERAKMGKNTLYGIDNTEISETVLKYQISDFP